MTTTQARNKVANIFFGSIIIAGLFMSYGAYVAQQVFANDDMSKKTDNLPISQNYEQKDENLTQIKPTTRWRLNSNGYSQRYVELTGVNRVERMHSLLQAYGHDNYEVWQTVARIHRIYPETLICLAYSETSLGKFTKTDWNVANIGNNDRGDTISYNNIEAGINAIGKTLNNRYMKGKTTVGDLYPFHIDKPCERDCQYVYASSTENAMNNHLNCLSMIYNKEISHKFNFRR